MMSLQVASIALTTCLAMAFSSRTPYYNRIQKESFVQSKRSRVVLHLDNQNGEANADNPLEGMELTSALSRIDQEWQIQQQKSPEKSRWTKLVLPSEEDIDDDTKNIREDPPLGQTRQQSEDDFVYLLEPSNAYSSAPSCMIVFVGGAGLGQFPNVAYSEFLLRLSDRLNAAILTVPYTVGLDHFELAKQTGDRLRRAILYCQDDPKRQYPESLPTFALSHSLGCKLQTIFVAATSQEYQGMGFISYNNFGFGQTIQMARSFAEQIRGNFGGAFDRNIMSRSEEAFDVIFGLAETVLGAVGFDFSPSAQDTERLIRLKFNDDLQKKTRLFVFDNDDLDSSEQFAQSCDGVGPTTSGLPGTHLTPVYIRLGMDNLPEETQQFSEYAKEFTGGYESASFGDEETLNKLVDEVSNWVLGKDPSRPARWKTVQAEAPRLTGIDKD